MNVFNIIGPIMIGPSRSHTAGAVRLGRVVNKVAGSSPDPLQEPIEGMERIELYLRGLWATTVTRKKSGMPWR